MSYAGVPRITSGISLVERIADAVFYAPSSERAHRLLLEAARRLAADRPPDQQLAFEWLHDMQQEVNTLSRPWPTSTYDADAYASVLHALERGA